MADNFNISDQPGGGGGGSPQACRVFNNANQSIPTGIATVFAFNSERFDTDAMHDNAVNNSRITINTAGKYAIGANIQWAANDGDVTLELLLNGATVIAKNIKGKRATTLEIDTMDDFSVTDFIECRVTQNNVGAQDVTFSAQSSPEFWAHRLS